jgi:MOSC domain-containing protein YiiM|tara:strand:+ start:1019 stop:1465 length:447 start_codon:yes stop_codon:yes gene_type:complete
MSEVYKLGISENNNKPINEVRSIDVLANQGVVGDRHFKEFNDPYNQISLIESENIDHYNIKYGLNIPYIDFRRNIVTKGIQLNDLVGKKILVGNVKLEGVDLCRPCRHLSEVLGQENIIKEFLRGGGLRCQILTSSSIKINDKISILN